MQNKTVITRKPKTEKRINSIIFDLKSYRNSIELLDGYASGKLVLKGKSYSVYKKPYTRTRADVKRYHWTKAKIMQQIELLEHELKILLEYGA